jgi:hypothetical protein
MLNRRDPRDNGIGLDAHDAPRLIAQELLPYRFGWALLLRNRLSICMRRRVIALAGWDSDLMNVFDKEHGVGLSSKRRAQQAERLGGTCRLALSEIG